MQDPLSHGPFDDWRHAANEFEQSGKRVTGTVIAMCIAAVVVVAIVAAHAVLTKPAPTVKPVKVNGCYVWSDLHMTCSRPRDI